MVLGFIMELKWIGWCMLSGQTKCKNSAKDIYDQIVEWKWHNQNFDDEKNLIQNASAWTLLCLMRLYNMQDSLKFCY